MNIQDKVKYMQFIRESNRIEGIHREPNKDEVDECARFVLLKEITLNDLVRFVKIYQQNAVLRDKKGLDVRVGNYFPPEGQASIRKWTLELLKAVQPTDGSRPLTPYEAHVRYESLHPFTDGNGRSGRMLWYWMMKGNAPLGFLHTWYYQSLDSVQNRDEMYKTPIEQPNIVRAAVAKKEVSNEKA